MNFIKSVKKNLKDPKKKSLTLLGLYFIFFIFVFAVINSAGNSDYNEEKFISKTALENYKDMSSYQYKFTFLDNGLTNIIDGTYYSDKTLFMYNDKKYFYESGSLYSIDNDSYYLSNIEYNINKLFNSNLYNILDNLQEESKTTYNDGRIKTNYVLDANIFYNYYFDQESNYQTNISIEITEKDNYIINISIDLTSIETNLRKIDIEYSNINNISNLEFNKDNYTYRE